MTKRIFTLATLLSFGLLFTACHDTSSKDGIPTKGEGADMNKTETAAKDDHAGHNHGEGEGHGTTGDGEMEGMETKGTDLGFAEGTWAWTLQDYINNGSGTKTFNLDQVSYDSDELSVEGNQQLDDLAALLMANPSMNAEVQCHSRKADNAIGRTAKKTATGARAIWVKEKLKFRGVEGDQLSAKGMADEALIAGIDGEDEAQNRITIQFTK